MEQQYTPAAAAAAADVAAAAAAAAAHANISSCSNPQQCSLATQQSAQLL
jgi:hypothetical protein